ncbi:Uncharacterised protein [Klebsiella pneumoniae]|nr:Uncharacterised protein [Klebsiella pneumoniae]
MYCYLYQNEYLIPAFIILSTLYLPNAERSASQTKAYIVA